jgi:hypothetical protein
LLSIDTENNPNFWTSTKQNHMSVDRCNTFCFPTIFMMILKRHYHDYPIIDNNKSNHEKSVRKCIPSILITYSIYRKSNLEWIVRVSGSVPEEILIYLDLFFFACCWCAKRASEHFLTISPLFFPSLPLSSTRALTHIHTDTVWWRRASVSIYFILFENARRWIKNRFIFFFSSSSSSSCQKHVQNGQITTTISTEIFRTKVKKKHEIRIFFFSFSNEIIYRIYYESIETNSIGYEKKKKIPIFLTFYIFYLLVIYLLELYARHSRVIEDICILKNEINFDLNKETNWLSRRLDRYKEPSILLIVNRCLESSIYIELFIYRIKRKR